MRVVSRAQWPPTSRRPSQQLPRPTSPAEPTVLARRLRDARVAAFLGDEPRAPEDELDLLVTRTARLYSDALAPDTRKAYARRWRLFVGWCESKNLGSLPAASETVMLYLADAIGDNREGAALSTLRGWLAAINRIHVEAGFAPPGDDPAMTMYLRTLRSVVPPRTAAGEVAALRIGPLREVCRTLDADEVDAVEVRDKAILCLHRAGVGDGEMSRLRWEDVKFTSSQATLLLRSPRADRGDRTVRLRRRTEAGVCGVASLRRWHEVSGRDAVWVFTPTDRRGGREDRAWRSKAIYSIRRSRRESIGGDIDTRIALLGEVPSEVLRDKAILLLGFAGAFRRPDLCNLRWSDVTFEERGAIVRLRRSKTDREGAGVDVGIPRGRSTLTCPVTAMQRWRERVTLQFGEQFDVDLPCFARVGRAGRIDAEPLTPEAITLVVRRRMAATGIEGRWGGRSLRRGFISTAADLGIRLEDIAKQSRHATLDSLILYIAADDPLRNNAASQTGM